jgi:hypothetical protein
MARRTSAVTMANEHVPIVTACQLVGMDLPDDFAYGRSMKLHCPFGELDHSDGGIEPAFRIYPETNSAYCFACRTAYTPVWLVAQAWDARPVDVAAELLDRIGFSPPSMAQAWARASRWEVPPDTSLLAEALKAYCRRVDPTWTTVQFTSAVAARLNRCLDLLDLVRTDADARQWLTGCKTAMAAVLTLPESSGQVECDQPRTWRSDA